MGTALDRCQRGNYGKETAYQSYWSSPVNTKNDTGEKKEINLAWKWRKLPEKFCQSI